jgi:hypothetical protein
MPALNSNAVFALLAQVELTGPDEERLNKKGEVL